MRINKISSSVAKQHPASESAQGKRGPLDGFHRKITATTSTRVHVVPSKHVHFPEVPRIWQRAGVVTWPANITPRGVSGGNDNTAYGRIWNFGSLHNKKLPYEMQGWWGGTRGDGDLICSRTPRQILDYYWRRLPCASLPSASLPHI